VTETEARNSVWSVLERILSERGIDDPKLEDSTSIVDDLGLDSLDFVELTVALEEQTGLEEFPMQAWVDEQMGSAEPRFSAGALAAAVVEAVRG
jgi:acyl carrier protein